MLNINYRVLSTTTLLLKVEVTDIHSQTLAKILLKFTLSAIVLVNDCNEIKENKLCYPTNFKL